MSALRTLLREYLTLRRALGYKLYWQGLQLQHFIEFAERAGATHITSDLAVKWATEPHASRSWWARRLSVVRGFARHCSSRDPRTLVPPPGLLPRAYRRRSPYLYRDEDIRRLLKAARELPSTVGLRPHTFETLFGLYVATGLRIQEALRLDRTDVDLAHGVLTIQGTKFGKTRYVPVHPSTRRALQRYARTRDRLCPHSASSEWFRERNGEPSDPVFPTRQGRALGHDGLDYLLKKHLLVARRHCPSLRQKRITFHCLRHSLAMSLLRGGTDRSVIALFLGHEQVETTSVYLHADMQLKEAALARTSTGKSRVRRYRPGDRLMAFLNGL